MAKQEKSRKILDERDKMPLFARILLVFSILQLVVAIGGYMATSADMMLLIFLAIAAIIVLMVTAFAWPFLKVYRRVIRAVLIALPSLLILLGVGLAIYTAAFDPATDSAANLASAGADADPMYILLFDLSVVLTYTHIIQAFFLPTMVAAASFGAKFDRILLSVQALLHAAIAAFMVFCASPYYFIPTWNTGESFMPSWYVGDVEIALIQLAVLVLETVFAVLTFIPALGGKQAEKSASA